MFELLHIDLDFNFILFGIWSGQQRKNVTVQEDMFPLYLRINLCILNAWPVMNIHITKILSCKISLLVIKFTTISTGAQPLNVITGKTIWSCDP